MEHCIQKSLAEVHALADHVFKERLDRRNLAELLGPDQDADRAGEPQPEGLGHLVADQLVNDRGVALLMITPSRVSAA